MTGGLPKECHGKEQVEGRMASGSLCYETTAWVLKLCPRPTGWLWQMWCNFFKFPKNCFRKTVLVLCSKWLDFHKQTAEWAAGCGVQESWLRVRLHASHTAPSATQEHRETKGRKKGYVMESSCMISEGTGNSYQWKKQRHSLSRKHG